MCDQACQEDNDSALNYVIEEVTKRLNQIIHERSKANYEIFMEELNGPLKTLTLENLSRRAIFHSNTDFFDTTLDFLRLNPDQKNLLRMIRKYMQYDKHQQTLDRDATSINFQRHYDSTINPYDARDKRDVAQKMRRGRDKIVQKIKKLLQEHPEARVILYKEINDYAPESFHILTLLLTAQAYANPAKIRLSRVHEEHCPQILDILYQHINQNYQDENGWTPLMHVIKMWQQDYHGHFADREVMGSKVLATILERSPNALYLGNQKGEAPLTLAASSYDIIPHHHGTIDMSWILKTLLAANKQENKEKRHQALLAQQAPKALRLAIENGRLRHASMLFWSGITTTDAPCTTTTAIEKESVNFTKELLHLWQRDPEDRKTAFAFFRFLLDCGMDPNYRNEWGDSGLSVVAQYAPCNEDYTCAQNLLELLLPVSVIHQRNAHRPDILDLANKSNSALARPIKHAIRNRFLDGPLSTENAIKEAILWGKNHPDLFNKKYYQGPLPLKHLALQELTKAHEKKVTINNE